MDQNTPPTASDLFGSGTEKQSTRDRLIEVALDLFYERGFHAVGIDSILSRVGVTKTTFYNHFESRDALAVEAIRRRDDWETDFYRRRVAEIAGDDPKAQLLALFTLLDEMFNDTQYAGCLFINACAEFPTRSDPVHQAAEAHYTKVHASLTDLAKQVGVDDPQSLASQWIVLCQGAITLRLISGDSQAALHAGEVAQQLLDAAIQKASKPD